MNYKNRLKKYVDSLKLVIPLVIFIAGLTIAIAAFTGTVYLLTYLFVSSGKIENPALLFGYLFLGIFLMVLSLESLSILYKENKWINPFLIISILFACVLGGAGVALVNHFYASKYPYTALTYNNVSNSTSFIICGSMAENRVPVVGDSFTCNLTLFRNISKGVDLKISLFHEHLLNRTIGGVYNEPDIETGRAIFNNLYVFITDEGANEFEFIIDANGNTIDSSPLVRYTAIAPKDYNSWNRDELGAYAGVAGLSLISSFSAIKNLMEIWDRRSLIKRKTRNKRRKIGRKKKRKAQRKKRKGR